MRGWIWPSRSYSCVIGTGPGVCGNDGEAGVLNNHAECSIVKGRFSIPRRRIAPPGVGWRRQQTQEK